MSSSMRNFMEAYSAVHNKEAKEEFYSHKDEISEMDFSLINQTELDDIAEEVLEELFEEGYSVEQCEAIFEEFLTEARVTYGRQTESPRAKKMFAMESSLKGAICKVKENAASGAVKSYGEYRDTKQAKANRLKEGASYVTAQTQRDAIKAKAKVRDGMKGMIGEAAKKVGDAANKVSNRMSEGTVRKDLRDIYQTIYEKKAAKDYDRDGEVESSKDEYFGSRDNAIKKAMGKKGKCEKCGKDPCECAKNEEFGQLDELSKGTMGSYVKKAAKDVEKRSYSQGETDAEDAEIGYPGQTPKDKKIDKRQKGIGKAVGKLTKKEEVTFSEAELKAIHAKVDAWDVEEGYQRNPEKGEAEARKSETSGQKTERNVRDRLKTMDPKKAEAMKKQMRAVGLNV